jgi:hypothetical protein
MILCLVCLAAVGMFCVAGCTTTPPKTNATNATANASVVATTKAAGNVTIPIINATLPAVNLSNVTLPQVNVTLPRLNST